MAGLQLRNISKNYGALNVIKGIDLDVTHGEFIVFVGPSGCGKSTLLRMIAGLEEITGGELTIGDALVNDVAPQDRGIAMVFQNYALYPHMTVEENVCFGLKLTGVPKDERNRRAAEAARILQIGHLMDRKPAQLSGGQRQRVAIGRAIVRDPKVFLFDEPLSNLDAALRAETRTEIAKLHRDLDATIIYVTHDQTEAMTLADRIVVLDKGIVQQVGSPLDLYNRPANVFVAGFIGNPKMNLMPVTFSASDTGVVMESAVLGVVPLGNTGPFSALAGAKGTIGFRAQHAEFDETAPKGTVEYVERLGDTTLVGLRYPSGDLVILTRPAIWEGDIGDTFGVKLDPDHSHYFGPDGQAIRAKD
ncbi:MAG: sn-glycerol-3-phosphate ABC transporter ATP-binding protein UgpC [Deltaproteobacteria bacterium]